MLSSSSLGQQRSPSSIYTGNTVNYDAYVPAAGAEDLTGIAALNNAVKNTTAVLEDNTVQDTIQKQGVLENTGTSAEKLTALEDKMSQNQKAQAVAGGIKGFADIMNAQSAYAAADANAQLKIMMVDRAIGDAETRGKSEQLAARGQASQAADSAAISMAAQGQDVNSAGVGAIKGAFLAQGEYQALISEINTAREVMGLQTEQVNLEFQRKSAENQRDAAVIGSLLNMGASAYGAF